MQIPAERGAPMSGKLRSGKCEGGPMSGQMLVHMYERYRVQILPNPKASRWSRRASRRPIETTPGDYVWSEDRGVWRWVGG
jgi:hypothetical protein